MTFRFLVSFHYHRNTDLQSIADAYGGPVDVFADSGAFSAATLGAEISLSDYAAWLKDWQHLVTTAATLDVIGDPDATQRNTGRLEDMGLRVLPVFHVGSPWSRLEELCKRYGYLALGGMVPHARDPEGVLRWLIRCFRIGREHGTVFHGFGQTRFRTMAALPFYSVDSSAWSAGSRFGQMYLWDERRYQLVSLPTGDAAQARKYATLLRAHGADPRLVGRPGFAVKARRSEDQFRREDLMMRGAPAIAYSRLGEWLIRRHQVPAPKGWNRPGTGLYVTDAGVHQITKAAKVLGTHLYLADSQRTNLTKAAGMAGQQGTRLYLANSEKINFLRAAPYLAADQRKDTP